MNLLHIDSSALGAHSVSRELSGAIVKAWKRAHPGAKVTYRDVAAQPLPHWTPVADAARQAGKGHVRRAGGGPERAPFAIANPFDAEEQD